MPTWQDRDTDFKQSLLLSLLPFAQETHRTESTSPKISDHRCHLRSVPASQPGRPLLPLGLFTATFSCHPEGPACSRVSYRVSQSYPRGQDIVRAAPATSVLSFAFHLDTPVCTAPSLLKQGPQEVAWCRGRTTQSLQPPSPGFKCSFYELLFPHLQMGGTLTSFTEALSHSANIY